MIFEKPDVLYFLFLLIIPILVHLFQLRKYKTTRFSNVALLERIQLQSRKSSTLKKWLLLTTRLLGLVFLILAFAKPFIPNTEAALEENEIVIYLDNSFSMELPGKRLSLLEEAKQNLWDQLEENQEFSLFTNDQTWKNVTKSAIKKDFFSIEFASVPLNFENLLLKAESMFEKRVSGRSLFIITDALHTEDDVRLKPTEDLNINIIVKSASSLENFSIASAQLKTDNTSKVLEARITSQAETEDDITVSLFDGEDLIAKTKANFDKTKATVVDFDLSNRDFKHGRLEIDPDGMSYDNTLFFSLNANKTINVLSLKAKPKTKGSFLSAIYQSEVFAYEEELISNFDYAKLSNVNLLILNEVEDFNPILVSRLKDYLQDGGTLALIPNKNSTPETFKEVTDGPSIYQNTTLEQREITSINFDHPLFQNVFSEQIENFDYPSTSKFMDIHPSFTPILKFSNARSFLAEKNRIFSFASSLNPDVSNFINSPLVVPVFYNMALQSSPTPQLYSTLGENNSIEIKVNLKKDEVLKLVNEHQQLIPQQTRLGNTVQINTQYQPKKAGFYDLKQGDSTRLHLSFNYDRQESELKPMDVSSLETQNFSSVPEAFNSFTEDRKILELWTWMLIFATGFFVIELLILRLLN